MSIRLLVGDCREVLKTLADESVQCCITSPPYFNLRDYGLPPTVWGGDAGCQHEWADATYQRRSNDGGSEDSKQVTNKGAIGREVPVTNGVCRLCGAWLGCLGLEPTPAEYVAHLVEVFREVRRVLRKDGTLWLNLGDSFASGKGTCFNPGGGENSLGQNRKEAGAHPLDRGNKSTLRKSGLKPKDLVGIPWRVAFALQADGWWLRSEITWIKKAPMPESATDRPTSATEKVFLLAKSAKYYYDAQAVRERSTGQNGMAASFARGTKEDLCPGQGYVQHRMERDAREDNGYRNMRNAWILGPEPYREAHFATFPTKLVEPCIMAGTSERGCCPKCGKPWERVVEKSRIIPKDYGGKCSSVDDPQFSARRMSANLRARREEGQPHDNPFPAPITTSWRPTCNCPGPDGDHPGSDLADYSEWPTVRCVVLDPFAGSGTVGVVAKRLGRDAVLIDLNPVYVNELAARRIERTQPALEGVIQ